MVLVLPLFAGWQFATTGLVMMSNLFLFSEGQWDMLLPRELKEYSVEEVNHVSLTRKSAHQDSSTRNQLSIISF